MPIKERNAIMANHKSSEKRIRQTSTRRIANRYHGKTARTSVRRLRAMPDYKEALEALPRVSSMLDKLAKRGVIHKNKAANIKSRLALHVNSLQA